MTKATITNHYNTIYCSRVEIRRDDTIIMFTISAKTYEEISKQLQERLEKEKVTEVNEIFLLKEKGQDWKEVEKF